MEFEKSKRIFIVDDNEMFAKLLSNYLAGHGHQVTVFYTKEECLKHVSENPDVVILDYYLNAVEKDAANGLKILESIRKNYPDTHVIMLSKQESYANALKTIQKGAEQYVIKDDSALEKIANLVKEI